MTPERVEPAVRARLRVACPTLTEVAWRGRKPVRGFSPLRPPEARLSAIWRPSHMSKRAAHSKRGRRGRAGPPALLGAFAEGQVVGTVQVILALPPNQPHRAEIAKIPRPPLGTQARHCATPHGACGVGSSGGRQVPAGAGHGDRRRRRASVCATRVDEGGRDPRLRPLPRQAALRHDRLLEGAFRRGCPKNNPALASSSRVALRLHRATSRLRASGSARRGGACPGRPAASQFASSASLTSRSASSLCSRRTAL